MSEPLGLAQAIAVARYHDCPQHESYDESILATAREIESYVGYAHLGITLAHELKLLRPCYMQHRLLDVLYEQESEVVREAFRGKSSAEDARTLIQIGFLQVIYRVIALMLSHDARPAYEIRALQNDLATVQMQHAKLTDTMQDVPSHLRSMHANSPLQVTRSMPNLIAFAATTKTVRGTSVTRRGTRKEQPRARRLSPAQPASPLTTILCDESIDQLEGMAEYEKRSLHQALRRAKERTKPQSVQRTRSAEEPVLAPFAMKQSAYALTAFVTATWLALEYNYPLPDRIAQQHTQNAIRLAQQHLALRALCEEACVLIDRNSPNVHVYLPPLLPAHSSILAKARTETGRVLGAAHGQLRAQCVDTAIELCILEALVGEALARTEEYVNAYRRVYVQDEVLPLSQLYRGLPERANWILDQRAQDGYQRYRELRDVLELVQRIVGGGLARLHHYLHVKQSMPEQLRWQRSDSSSASLHVPQSPEQSPRGSVGRSRHVSLGHMRPRANRVLPSSPIPIPVQQHRAIAQYCKLESPPRTPIPAIALPAFSNKGC